MRLLGMNNLFWWGLDGKGGSIFGEGFRIFRDSNYKFYMTLIWITIYVQTEICCINCYFWLTLLAYLVLRKYVLIASYFITISSLFTRKSVEMLTQVSIKIPKISYFSFTFRLNEKYCKKMVRRGGYKETFARGGEGVWSSIGWLEIFPKKNRWLDTKGMEKK